MNFDNEKKQAIEKIIKFDNSKKGSIDIQILPLIQKINNHPDFYTTSSCAGRIMLIIPNTTKNKYDAEWLFSSHGYAKKEDILDNVGKGSDGTSWLRMEPPIIHVCARDLDSAYDLMNKANEAGFRRSALLSFKKRIIVEIMIPEKMDVPVSEGKQLLVSEPYLEKLIGYANQKLKESRKKLKKLEKLFLQ